VDEPVRADARDYTILQLSDLHLLPDEGARLLGVDTGATFAAVLEGALARDDVDAVFVTGDIAHEGDVDAYRRARMMLERHCRVPVVWLPGNHDLEGPLVATFGDRRDVVVGAWHLVGIDTHVEGMEHGRVSCHELDRLAAVLAGSSARNVLVFGHHPCVKVGTAWLDGGRIENSAELLELLHADARVRGYGFGHIHHAAPYAGAAWPILSAPSTCFAFAQGGASFAVAAAAPGCRRFTLRGDGRLDSAIVHAGSVVTPDLASFVSAGKHG
jgi:Icc protein